MTVHLYIKRTLKFVSFIMFTYSLARRIHKLIHMKNIEINAPSVEKTEIGYELVDDEYDPGKDMPESGSGYYR